MSDSQNINWGYSLFSW